MIKHATAVALMLLPLAAQARDFAVIITEQERVALVQLIDEAVKAKGLAVAGTAVFLVNKINAAPEVQEQKQPPKEPKQ